MLTWLRPSVPQLPQVLCVLSMTLQAPVCACRILVDGGAEDNDEGFSTRGRKEHILWRVYFAYRQVAKRKLGPGPGRKSPRTVPFCPRHIFLFSVQLCTQTEPSPTLCSILEPECLIWNMKTEADMGYLKIKSLPQSNFPN